MEAALIKTDKETLSRLKKAAGDKPVAAYIRELSIGLPSPDNIRLDAIETNVQNMSDAIEDMHKALMESLQGYSASYNKHH